MRDPSRLRPFGAALALQNQPIGISRSSQFHQDSACWSGDAIYAVNTFQRSYICPIEWARLAQLFGYVQQGDRFDLHLFPALAHLSDSISHLEPRQILMRKLHRDRPFAHR